MFNQNAIEILNKRYLNKDKNGNPVETYKDVLPRVVNFVFDEDEVLRKEMLKVFENLEALPSTPILMNAGTGRNQMSACFVLGIEDDTDSIYDNLRYQAQIQRTGGGTGFDFSRIRPKGDIVGSTGGAASGPISYMRLFDVSTDVIKQGGMRKGANMAILRVDHPDILEFIKCKEKNTDLQNMNISVGITKAFMDALEHKTKYQLINPRDKSVWGELFAETVLNLIAEYAWKNGEPGVVFLDEINKYNPIKGENHKIRSTNPCGEQPLEDFESCNLMSINLTKFYREGLGFDYQRLDEVTRLCVQFLDGVLDKNNYPYDFIKEKTLSNRKIGIGVMGFAELLINMNIAYGSGNSLDLIHTIMGVICGAADLESQDIAEQKGTFPNFGKSFFDVPMRNATLTTIAPTGTISVLAGTSGGIEPYPFFVFKRNQADLELFEVAAPLKKILQKLGIDTKEIHEKIYQNGINIPEIPQKYKDILLTSQDVSIDGHLDVMAAFQDFTDNAISKTVVLPNNATIEEIKDIYVQAHARHLKGITVYRDGSRDSQPLSNGKSFKMESETEPKQAKETYIEREQITYGTTTVVKIGCGKLYVTVNKNSNGDILEVFTTTGKHGGCPSQSEGLARIISIGLRSGTPIKKIIEQLKGIRCFSCIVKKDVSVLSCPDAIARVLENSFEQKNEIIKIEKIEENNNDNNNSKKCPECGSDMLLSEGCTTCSNAACGFSKCG